ncbi:unnamed protein product [Nippostrongylus brasiliensis]|uniref:Uncharacterized protein n=1 Tax=Nippostrongylus brasiliensis TaxID=27835 RepID=A0A0N4YZ35_NIPBR|nr:unnamed protein product [Nippostrongylus brasiliensis]
MKSDEDEEKEQKETEGTEKKEKKEKKTIEEEKGEEEKQQEGKGEEEKEIVPEFNTQPVVLFPVPSRNFIYLFTYLPYPQGCELQSSVTKSV